jgi:hypothetical protein
MGKKTGLFSRQLLAALVSGSLLALPSLSAPQIAAVAGPSTAATVRGSEVGQGTNIFHGDIVEVAHGGESILLLKQNATVRVPSDSAVRFFKCGERSVVQLLRGQVIFRATPKQPIEVQLGDAIIRSTPGQDVMGVVSLTTPATASMTASQGSFTVTTAHQKKSVLVHEGETREAQLTSPPSTATANPPICGVGAAVLSAPSTTAWVMLGLGAAGLAIPLALRGQQPQLTCAQKGALVSPYQFPCL